MKPVSNDLVSYVETEILPRYDAFDPAHRRGHILKVISNSMALADISMWIRIWFMP